MRIAQTLHRRTPSQRKEVCVVCHQTENAKTLRQTPHAKSAKRLGLPAHQLKLEGELLYTIFWIFYVAVTGAWRCSCLSQDVCTRGFQLSSAKSLRSLRCSFVFVYSHALEALYACWSKVARCGCGDEVVAIMLYLFTWEFILALAINQPNLNALL